MNTIQNGSGLSPEKQALLENRLLKLLAARKARETPQAMPASGPRALSFAQESMWFINQLLPSSPLYNIPQAIQLTGEIDTEALQRALAAMVERHEILRARFIETDGRPSQVISPYEGFTLPMVDVSECLPAERQAKLERFLSEEARCPFDLTTDLMLRASLVRTGQQEYVLLISIHHIVADALSLEIFYRELSKLYTAFSNGESSPLPPLRARYLDFVEEQRRSIREEVINRQIHYWKSELAGEWPPLRLPQRTGAPSIPGFQGARIPIRYSASLLAQLQLLSRREESTLYTILLAGFQALLHRYSGQDRILVGSPIGVRPQSSAEELIGLFLNMTVLKADFSNNPRFDSILKDVRKTVFGAFANLDVPLERIVNELGVPRVPGRQPLFQAAFQFFSGVSALPDFPNVTARMLPMETGTAKFDFTLTLIETPEGIGGDLEYNTELYDAETALGIIRHLEVLLESICANPAQPVGSLALLGRDEECQLLSTWNDTTVLYPRNASIATVFGQQAATSPDAVALVTENQELSYRKLDLRANRLANYLIRSGVARGDRVGICLERSFDLVVALMATLKAGAAYVPLDPAYPAKRLEFMIADTAAPVLLTTTALASSLPQSRARVICLDRERDEIDREPADCPSTGVAGDDIAYIIYTSGSTGQPKGVAVPQRAVTRLVKNANYAKFGPDEVFYLFAPISFDASTFEVWGALLNGARLIISPPGLDSLEELGRSIERNKVTTLWLTAGLFHQMIDTQIGSLRQVRQLLAGGDVLSVAHVLKALRELPDTHIINGYGPTENTTFTCCYDVPRNWSGGSSVPIGRPISNTQTFIVDRYGAIVPVGVTGELLCAGDGLAREYLNAPELTAQKFVTRSLAGRSPRAYRTGDLARWLPDGTIEFVGRIDQQLKIRGFRVEPGEIERALSLLPSVRQCVVIAREDAFGQKYLAAYVATAPGAKSSPAELRTALSNKLPPHMVPSRIVILDDLPLTANGKIDRARLPVPQETPAASAPVRTAHEHVLAQIWSEVLGGRSVGLHDNFFECGGHSLLATRVISRVAKATGVTLSLRHFFERPTLQALAVELARAAGDAPAQEDVIKPEPATAEGLYPLSCPQQRLWFVEQLQSLNPVYNIPLAYELRGELDVAALENSLRAVINRHEILRTTFKAVQNAPVQRVNPDSGFSLAVSDLSADPAQLPEQLANDSCSPFDLESGPLFRGRLYRLSPHDHVLFLNVHHIAFDEWSVDILHREVAAIYSGLVSGQSPRLDPLPIQYRDFARWQQESGSAGAFARDIEYWKQALAGSGPPLELPADLPRPTNPTCQGGIVRQTLPTALTASLKLLCRKEGVTPYVLLLAAFDTLLCRYSGREDVIIGVPVSGRTRLESEPLLGFFVNMLPVRADLSGNPTFQEVLTRVREANLQAMAHQNAPFEKIVESLHASRERLPLFGVVFTLQHKPDALRLPGVESKSLLIHPGTSKFDLIMAVQDQGDDFSLLVEYSRDLFEHETASRLLGHFETLLQSIVANPTQTISKLAMVSASEREQLVCGWNETATAYPREESLDSLFEAQAKKTPNVVAVRYGADAITYSELNERSSQMARSLRKLGIGADSPVGILLERSVDMIVAWVAVLKAGGAYVPLDLDYPQQWISFVLQDTRMPVVITRNAWADKIPAGATQALFIDAPWIAPEDADTTPARARLTSERLAYIIYTSGSTGRPKGVAVPHRAVVRLLFETNYVHFDGSERFAQVSNSAFDAATFEVWGTLLFGGSLIGANKETILSPTSFAAFLASERITTMFLTTALFNQVAADQPDAFSGSREVLVGGAACDPEAMRRVLAGNPPKRLLNAYGPTESTTFAAWHEVKSLSPQARSVPIGQPLANTTLYVLDRELQPVPVGISGELYIGGDGLARGYFNRPELTAERFIRNPFSNDPQSRLYKTGDLARRLPDGSIDYLGRLDDQVKIRGFRIEPGEIQFVLKQIAGIRDAIVLARQDTPGDKRLAAYYIADEQGAPDVAHVRQYLRDRLPPYMIPSSYQRLDAFPLTPNGKIDHRALPAPGTQTPGAAVCPPRTELEIQLFEVWRQVLDRSDFGIHEDFFEIGGHSLLAVRLVAETEKAIGIKLPLPILFQAATIEKLAQALSHNAPFSPGSCLVKIQPNGSRPPIFWPHTLGGGAGGGLFTYRKLAQLLGPDQPSYGFVAPAQPFTTIETMAAHYIQEMKRICPTGPYLLGGYCFAGVVAYEMARQLRERGEEVALLALLDSSLPDPTRERTRLGWKLALHFLQTFPFWLAEFLAQHPGEMLRAIQWKASVLARKFRRRPVPQTETSVTPGIPTVENLDDIVDMSAYPHEYRNFARVHWLAFTSYIPKPFLGKAILFRGDERYLTRLDGIDSWRKVILGGLEVRKITGKHEAVLAEPCVHSLAKELRECIEHSKSTT